MPKSNEHKKIKKSTNESKTKDQEKKIKEIKKIWRKGNWENGIY